MTRSIRKVIELMQEDSRTFGASYGYFDIPAFKPTYYPIFCFVVGGPTLGLGELPQIGTKKLIMNDQGYVIVFTENLTEEQKKSLPGFLIQENGFFTIMMFSPNELIEHVTQFKRKDSFIKSAQRTLSGLRPTKTSKFDPSKMVRSSPHPRQRAISLQSSVPCFLNAGSLYE